MGESSSHKMAITMVSAISLTTVALSRTRGNRTWGRSRRCGVVADPTVSGPPLPRRTTAAQRQQVLDGQIGGGQDREGDAQHEQRSRRAGLLGPEHGADQRVRCHGEYQQAGDRTHGDDPQRAEGAPAGASSTGGPASGNLRARDRTPAPIATQMRTLAATAMDGVGGGRCGSKKRCLAAMMSMFWRTAMTASPAIGAPARQMWRPARLSTVWPSAPRRRPAWAGGIGPELPGAVNRHGDVGQDRTQVRPGHPESRWPREGACEEAGAILLADQAHADALR